MFERVLDALSEVPRGVFWTVSFVVLWALMSAAAFLPVMLVFAMSVLADASIAASPLLIAAGIGFFITGIVYLLIGWEVSR